MTTGYEAGAYRDLGTIADQVRDQTAVMKEIRAALELLADKDRYEGHPLNSLDEVAPVGAMLAALESIAKSLKKIANPSPSLPKPPPEHTWLEEAGHAEVGRKQ